MGGNHNLTVWETKFVSEIKKKVLRGQYSAALRVARKALKQHPDNFVCLYQYAKLLGDWADELPKQKQKLYKKEATKILKKLTRRLAGKSWELRFGICLNYYYQSKEFHKMYAYGSRIVRVDGQRALYSQGLGACLLSYDYFLKGRALASQSWAQKSVRSWKKYNLASEKYYFAHYTYAKALALLGAKASAYKALKSAARLSRRKLSAWEFKDVIELLS